MGAIIGKDFRVFSVSLVDSITVIFKNGKTPNTEKRGEKWLIACSIMIFSTTVHKNINLPHEGIDNRLLQKTTTIKTTKCQQTNKQ